MKNNNYKKYKQKFFSKNFLINKKVENKKKKFIIKNKNYKEFKIIKRYSLKYFIKLIKKHAISKYNFWWTLSYRKRLKREIYNILKVSFLPDEISLKKGYNDFLPILRLYNNLKFKKKWFPNDQIKHYDSSILSLINTFKRIHNKLYFYSWSKSLFFCFTSLLYRSGKKKKQNNIEKKKEEVINIIEDKKDNQNQGVLSWWKNYGKDNLDENSKELSDVNIKINKDDVNNVKNETFKEEVNKKSLYFYKNILLNNYKNKLKDRIKKALVKKRVRLAKINRTGKGLLINKKKKIDVYI